jgi:nitrogen fixation/metabolism regulation signal transduction histidine kinase
VAVVKFSKDRAIIQAGHRLQMTTIAGVALLLVLLLATLTFVINRSLVAPLHRLKGHVDRIGETGELVEIAHDGRRDEIGALALEFNEMIAQLRDLRARMEAQSFQIGKNQSAIGSLHNVNNGLCPIKTLLSLLPADLAIPARELVQRALAELAAPNINAARRQQLTAFVAAAIERIVEQLAEAQLKVAEANRAINLVVDTIAAQRASALVAGDSSLCDLTAVVNSNLAIATYNDKGFPVSVDYADDQRRLVHGDRVLIGQVVGNVLTNAVEAIAASKRGEGQIRITGSTVIAEGRAMECIAITDNGDGFEPAKAPDLFKRGFSTRTDKQGGLGLHWCANTINAMGGTLSIESAGPGTGATTTITLPRFTEASEAPAEPEAAPSAAAA